MLVTGLLGKLGKATAHICLFPSNKLALPIRKTKMLGPSRTCKSPQHSDGVRIRPELQWSTLRNPNTAPGTLCSFPRPPTVLQLTNGHLCPCWPEARGAPGGVCFSEGVQTCLQIWKVPPRPENSHLLCCGFHALQYWDPQ